MMQPFETDSFATIESKRCPGMMLGAIPKVAPLKQNNTIELEAFSADHVAPLKWFIREYREGLSRQR